MDKYLVEIIWRYAEGHRGTAVRSKVVKAYNNESAEAWAVHGLRTKFKGHAIEVIKVTSQYIG